MIDAGFESPTYSEKVVTDQTTPISKPATVDYLWKQNNYDQEMWKNPEWVNKN